MRVSGDTEIVWVPPERLVAAEVGEWMELPLWLSDPGLAGMLDADVSLAIEAGLTFRPLTDTVRETLDLADTVDGVGLTPERETELLAAAHS
jgi:2'-hydroxyisoflavone reductase